VTAAALEEIQTLIAKWDAVLEDEEFIHTLDEVEDYVRQVKETRQRVIDGEDPPSSSGRNEA
jgi:hypothetical protein